MGCVEDGFRSRSPFSYPPFPSKGENKSWSKREPSQWSRLSKIDGNSFDRSHDGYPRCQNCSHCFSRVFEARTRHVCAPRTLTSNPESSSTTAKGNSCESPAQMDQNRVVPNIDGTWLFRIIPDISGAGYEVSKPIPYPKQALNPVLPYLKNGPKLWSIPHCGIHKTLSAIFKGLLNGSYGRIVLSAFPPGTLLTPEIVESMFWGSYGDPMDLWLSKGTFIGSKNRLFTSIFWFWTLGTELLIPN